MDWEEAERTTKAFEEAYVTAHANQDIEALREGFHPDVEIFLNGRLQAQGLDAYLDLYEPMLRTMGDFALTKTCRGVGVAASVLRYEKITSFDRPSSPAGGTFKGQRPHSKQNHFVL